MLLRADRVVEIYELKWEGWFLFFFFFLSDESGTRRFLLSRAQLRRLFSFLFFFFPRRKVYRGEIMSRDEREERDLVEKIEVYLLVG